MILKLPARYKPSKGEPFMNEMQKLYFKLKLLDWKKEIEKDVAKTIEKLKNRPSGPLDNAEKASNVTEYAIELRTRDRLRKLIDKIDAALENIENGTYGYCVSTGEPIAIERLEARPITNLCLEAQEMHEKKEKIFRN